MLTHLLNKDDLRSLLMHLARPSSGALSLSAGALRGANQWAIAAGLVEPQGLTTAGTLVATKDPYLETTVTDWLIHVHLSLSDHRLWKYFIYEFLPNYSSFTQDELLHSCREKFTMELPETLRKSVRALLNAYTETEAIARSKFLSQEKKRYSSSNPDLSNPYNIGYCLAKVWERDFQSQQHVLVNEIVDADVGLTKILGITREQLQQQLDLLATHNIIEQRSAKPHLAGTKSFIKGEAESIYQVHRCWETSLDLLEKAYENDLATPNRPLIQSLGALIEDGGEVPDFSQFLEWASGLVVLDGGSKMITNLAS